MLAKITFGREPMLMVVFASDQYKPSIHYEDPEQTDDKPPDLGSGLTNRWLHLNPKSWSLMRIQRQSPTLWPTRGRLTSTTSSVRCCW